MTTPRSIALEGAHNMRDLGGVQTTGGREVKRGVLFRADALHNLTDADLKTLAPLNIATVFDFRSPVELEQTGKARLVEAGAHYVNAPLSNYDPSRPIAVTHKTMGESYQDRARGVVENKWTFGTSHGITETRAAWLVPNRHRVAILIERNHGEAPLGNLHLFAAFCSFGVGGNMDCDAGAADTLHRGVAQQTIADIHRFVKHHAIECNSHKPVLRLLAGADPGGKIHLTHKPTTEDIATAVGIRWHGHYADHQIIQIWHRPS